LKFASNIFVVGDNLINIRKEMGQNERNKERKGTE
jgi:hypothetical protein